MASTTIASKSRYLTEAAGRRAIRDTIDPRPNSSDITMAGLDKRTPMPTRIVVHTQSRVLEIGFSDGTGFRLPLELLRVYSPSAQVRGHGPGQEVLQVGKQDVGITQVEPVGHYAIQPFFSDGHSSGIFSWDYLHWLGSHQDRLWQDYLDRLQAAGSSRDPAEIAPGVAAAAADTAVAAISMSRPRP